jgi:DNA replication and repair protein RecF
MYLDRITLINFKNYREAELAFSPRINCLVGDNGSGKTNLLDAIHYLSFCKSFFNPTDMQNICHGESFFAIHGLFTGDGDRSDLVSCVVQPNQRKQFSLNKKEYDRLADHIGLLPLVMISPYDRDLINDGSDIRRKYLDSVISQVNRLYLDDLINYNKALAQRNLLLKQFAEGNYFDQASLEIWDKQLVRYGQNIFAERESFIRGFMPLFADFYRLVSGGRETAGMEYDSKLRGESFENLLKEAMRYDRAARFSTVGVHKDDLLLYIDGHPVKKFGSQGQQKSFVIAMRLAQFDYIRKSKGMKPILLLDDIFDKLDDNRVEQLVKMVSNDDFGQVFITDTQQARVKELLGKLHSDHRLFSISNGEIHDLKDESHEEVQ